MTDREALFAEFWSGKEASEMEAARMFNTEVKPVSWAWHHPLPTTYERKF